MLGCRGAAAYAAVRGEGGRGRCECSSERGGDGVHYRQTGHFSIRQALPPIIGQALPPLVLGRPRPPIEIIGQALSPIGQALPLVSRTR